MFWKKKSNLNKDIEQFKFIAQQIIDHDHFISRVNARKQIKELLERLYIEYYYDWDKRDWDHYLFEFSKETYEELNKEQQELLTEELTDEEEYLAELIADKESFKEDILSTKKTIKNLKNKIKLIKKCASYMFIEFLQMEMSTHQLNDDESFLFRQETNYVFDLITNRAEKFNDKGLL